MEDYVRAFRYSRRRRRRADESRVFHQAGALTNVKLTWLHYLAQSHGFHVIDCWSEADEYSDVSQR